MTRTRIAQAFACHIDLNSSNTNSNGSNVDQYLYSPLLQQLGNQLEQEMYGSSAPQTTRTPFDGGPGSPFAPNGSGGLVSNVPPGVTSGTTGGPAAGGQGGDGPPRGGGGTIDMGNDNGGDYTGGLGLDTGPGGSPPSSGGGLIGGLLGGGNGGNGGWAPGSGSGTGGYNVPPNSTPPTDYPPGPGHDGGGAPDGNGGFSGGGTGGWAPGSGEFGGGGGGLGGGPKMERMTTSGGSQDSGMRTASGAAASGAAQPFSTDYSSSPAGQQFLNQWRAGELNGSIPKNMIPAVQNGQFTLVDQMSVPWSQAARYAAAGPSQYTGGPAVGGYNGSTSLGQSGFGPNGATAPQSPQAPQTGGGFGAQGSTATGGPPLTDPGRGGISLSNRPPAGTPGSGSGTRPTTTVPPGPPSGNIYGTGGVPNPYPQPNPGGPGSQPPGSPPVTGTNPTGGSITGWDQGGAAGNRNITGAQLYNNYSQTLANPNMPPDVQNALEQAGMDATKANYSGAQGQLARHVASTGNSAGYAAGQAALTRNEGSALGQQARQNKLDEYNAMLANRNYASQGLGNLYSGETSYLSNLQGLTGGLAKMPLGKFGQSSNDTNAFGMGLSI